MAVTRQKQKQKPQTTTTPKTEVTQQQSLEIVQTLVHGTLSNTCFLRGLLPERALQDAVIGNSDRLVYTDFAAGKLNQKKSTQDFTNLKAMRRGESVRVDTFLDWLEIGAFTALKDNRLHAVCVYVHAQPDRKELLEKYVFTIQYDSDGEHGKLLAGVQIATRQDSVRTVEATMAGLQTFLREISTRCGKLPDLPDIRFLSMKLVYDGEDYNPPGFVPDTTSDPSFASAAGWTKQTKAVTDFMSRYHGAGLTITYLQPPSQPENVGVHEEAAGKSNEDDVGSSKTDTPSTVVAEDLFDPEPALAKQSNDSVQPSQHIAGQSRVRSNAQSMHPEPRGPRGTFHESLDTQSSNVPRMKSAFDDMLQPERMTQGDTQTQAPPRAPRAGTRSLTTPAAKLPSDGKLTLLPGVAAGLKSEKAKLYRTATRLVAPKQKRNQPEDVVLCQCQQDGRDRDMLHCTFCDTRQHFYCYGFSGASDDPRRPAIHACYQCLFGSNDAAMLDELRDLAVKRRIVLFGLRTGPWETTDMAESLNIPKDDAARLQSELLEADFIEAEPNSQDPGFAKTRQSRFRPAIGAASHRAMIEQLFDPLVVVEKYYAKDANMLTPFAVAKRFHRVRPASMSPPAMSSSSDRGQDASTVVSECDSRASKSPNVTPSPRKRASDEPDIFSTPAQRAATGTPLFKRLKSVLSKSSLKAYGSSPAPVGR